MNLQTVYPQACESTGHVVDAFVDASKRGTITADFSWDKMSIGEEYQINYRGDGVNTSPVALTDTMYQALNLVANTTYNWRVRVKCNGVWQSWPGYQASFTTPTSLIAEDSTQFVALKDLYLALNGDDWGVNWPISDELENVDPFYDRTTYSGWDGLTVVNGKVTKIDFSKFGLVGTIPASLSNLDSLLVLNLSANNLTATSDEMWQLSRIQEINLGNNQIDEVMEDSLESLSDLHTINLSNNALQSIPSKFIHLDNLIDLDVSYNEIENLPNFNEMVNVEALDLNVSGNKLDLEDIVYFLAKEDELIFRAFNFDDQARLPIKFYHNNGSYFDLQHDTIEFINGDHIAFYTRTDSEDIFYSWQINQGDGWENLPEGKSRGWRLSSASAANEGLYRCKVISSTLSGYALYTHEFYLKAEEAVLIEEDRMQFEALRDLFYALDGKKWKTRSWPSFETFAQLDMDGSFLDRNSWSNWDGVSVLDGNVVNISLAGRNLVGTLPSSISNLSELSFINLSNNAISGSLPQEIALLENLHTLLLSSNQLSGDLPDFSPSQIHLWRMELENNELGGSLNKIKMLVGLQQVRLQGNQFSSIPADFFDGIPGLLTLDLESNAFASLPVFAFASDVSSVNVDLKSNILPFKPIEQFYDEDGHPFASLALHEQKPVFALDSAYQFRLLEEAFIKDSIPGELNHYRWEKNFFSTPHFEDWRTFKDSTNTLRFPDFDFADEDQYRLVVTNELVPFTLISNAINVTGRSDTEFLALKDLYTSTNGDNWTNHDGWPTQAEFDEMDKTNARLNVDEIVEWYGVRLNDLKIVQIDLAWNNLTGTIPATIKNFRDLSNLHLNANNLTGQIPKELGQIQYLNVLDLSQNNLIGTVPDEIFTPYLSYLNLSNNDRLYPGKLDRYTTLSNLTYLNLSRLNIPEFIPSTIGQLTNLRQLWLGDCSLGGPIPDEIWNLTNLTYLSLGENDLIGSISSQIGQLTQLYGLYLNSNKLSGNIPSEITRLSNLHLLFLNHNQLSGALPSAIGNLSNIFYLDVENNNLSGSLPASFAFPDMSLLNLSRNQFGGEIPASIGQMSSMIQLLLGENEFTSWDASTLSSLTSINHMDLGSNQINQSIPSGFGKLSNLNFIDLSFNEFYGDIPNELLQNDRINNIFLTANNLTGFQGGPDDITNTEMQFWVDRNKLDFADLLPFFTKPGVSIFKDFHYGPQQIQYLGDIQTFTTNYAIDGIYKARFSYPLIANVTNYTLVAFNPDRYEWVQRMIADGTTDGSLEDIWYEKEGYIDLLIPEVPGLPIYPRFSFGENPRFPFGENPNIPEDSMHFDLTNSMLPGVVLKSKKIYYNIEDDLLTNEMNVRNLSPRRNVLFFKDKGLGGNSFFRIYRRIQGEPEYEIVGAVGAADKWIDTDLEPNTTYEYKLSTLVGQTETMGTYIAIVTTAASNLTIADRPDKFQTHNTTFLYDESGQLISKQRKYFDNSGNILQSQTLNMYEERPIVKTYEYDEYDRLSKASLPYTRFILEDASFGKMKAFLFKPDYYYSNDPILPTATSYFTEYTYDENGNTKTAIPPGFSPDAVVPRSYSMAADISELPGYTAIRNQVLGVTKPLTSLVKQIRVDPNGKRSVSYLDASGNSIATALSGGVADYLTSTSFNYRGDFHLPASGNVIVSPTLGLKVDIYNISDETTLITSTTGGTINLTAGFYRVVASSTKDNVIVSPSLEDILTMDISKLLDSATLAIWNISDNIKRPASFYRAVASSASNTEDSVTLSYHVDYSHFSYSVYDYAGRIIKSITPNGVDQFNNGVPLTLVDASTNSHEQSGLVKQRIQSDAGQTTFKYTKAGRLRFGQDEEQVSRGVNVFTYLDYDIQGRTIESGEYVGSTVDFGSTEMEGLTEQIGFNTWPSEDKKNVVTQFFDFADQEFSSETGLSYVQEHLKAELSFTENEHVKTWYSYEHTHKLKWMVQKFKALDQIFTLDYSYNGAGQVQTIAYQKEELSESFYHHYTYDLNQRLKKVYTSTDGDIDNAYEHANYMYSGHGPLHRIELAENLQGIDYSYTIDGALKTINSPGVADPSYDGKNHFSPDAFSLSMEYFENDFANTFGWYHPLGALPDVSNQFNGTTRAIRWQHVDQTFNLSQEKLYAYSYDERTQLTGATFTHNIVGYSPTSQALGLNKVAYDLNGNLEALRRYDDSGTPLHELTYTYNSQSEAQKNNRLEEISGYASFSHDEKGRITSYNFADTTPDQYFEYNQADLMTAVYADSEKTTLLHRYAYDERGFRILKHDEQADMETWYVRDAQGSIIAIYYRSGSTLVQGEIPIYGSERLGTAFKNVDHYQYNYELRDHQSNVRAVVTKLKFMSTATMEAENIAYENLRFQNLSTTRQQDVVYAPNGAYAALLNPALSGGHTVGPAKSLRVLKGDVVKMSVNTIYEPATSDNTFVGVIGSLITSAFSLTAAGSESQATTAIAHSVGSEARVTTPTNARLPKAYLQYLLFDDHYKPVGIQDGECHCFKRVTTQAENQVESLELEVDIEADGYIYIYVANESTNDVNVFFDDLTVTHLGAKLLQTTDYYPFGAVASQWTDEDYRFGYQGLFTEKDPETGLVHFEARNYDPIAGRWLAVDPQGQFSSSYVGMGNNPIMYVDPDGEFVFSALLPGVGVFIDAALWGAVIGGAGYTTSIGFSDGGFSNWDSGQFWKSVGIGAVSGVATASIGQAFGPVGSGGIAGEIGRAYTHGFVQGTISEFTGGDFMTGFASGGLGSLGGSAFMMYGGKLANSTAGLYGFSGLAGGAGSAATGGNFWEGAAMGVMNAGLNHARSMVDQAGARYFANKKAYNDYLWESSFDENGNPIREVSGWELENGDAIALPYDKNYIADDGTFVSYNDGLPVRGKPGNLNVEFKGSRYRVGTHTHTHPQSYGLYPKGYSGGPDASMIRLVGKPIHILHRANLYRVGLRSNGTFWNTNLGPWK